MDITREAPPMLRLVAALLVGVEALVLVVAAVRGVAGALSGDTADAALALAALAGMGALVLAVVAVSLGRGRTWPRGLAVTWQLLQIAAGALLVQWSLAAGLAAIGVGIATAALLVVDSRAHPSV